MTYKTPMLQQYQAIKEQYPDCLLFFRLGDFYELFGDDAKIGSEVLHITLTARDKGSDGKIPMCGVPFHASENYVARLVQAGHKVAICEQMTAPGNGLVQREVVRVVTAGTLLRDESLTDAGSQYLLSFSVSNKEVAGAAADLSTGEFWVFSFVRPPEEIIPLVISHFSPREVVLPRTLYDNHHLISLMRQERQVNITCAHDWLIYIKDTETLLKNHFLVESLDSFGLTNKPEATKSAAALLGYLRYTQKGNVAHITTLKEFHLTGHLVLDQTTLRHLEIVRTQEGTIDGSLFNAINHTVTAAGQRLLYDWLLHPITNREELTKRHDALADVLSQPLLMQQAQEALVHVSDCERLVGRLSVGLGTPRDLRRLADTLWHIGENVFPLFSSLKNERLKYLTQPLSSFRTSEVSEKSRRDLSPPAADRDDLVSWIAHIRSNLFEEAKPTLDEGYIFTEGFNTELDSLRQLTSGNKTWLAAFEAQERERTKITKLRVVYSRAFGYAIEITKGAKDLVPPDYIPRQTLVNAERYTCQALADYEHKALTAMDHMIALEKQLFNQEVERVVLLAVHITEIAQRVAQLDVLLSFAQGTTLYRYTRPQLTDEVGIAIKNGRHPVIEQLQEAPFVANDTHLTPQHSLQLITGPNMAGKSTYIRQVALIVLLAHTGSYVPADEATIGITDRIFTRIGAHDNLRAGQSTFMVEMLETAHILHNVTARSLVILDEVGRGTSPEDGFAIAWAIVENLAHDASGLVLFATHFHALKDSAQTNTKIFNSHLAVAIDNDDLIFLRKVVDGATDESYGIVVAEKAGIPKKVIQRAQRLTTESSARGHGAKDLNQLSLLAAATHAKPEHDDLFKQKIKDVPINSLTPLQALALLDQLQREAKEM